MMSHWFESREMQTLGWALIHSLWELTLLAAITATILALLRRRSAALRYLVSCAAMLAMVVAVCATYAYLLPPRAPKTATVRPVDTVSIPVDFSTMPDIELPFRPVARTAAPAFAVPLSVRVTHWLQPLLPPAVACYFAGVLLLTLRMAGGYGRLRLLTRRALPAAGDAQSLLTSLMQRLDLTRPIRLLESAAVEVPTVLGIIKPVILLPATALTGLSPDQLSVLLAHELAHIRRFDPIANLFQSVIETLLFYHPAIWWLSARLRRSANIVAMIWRSRSRATGYCMPGRWRRWRRCGLCHRCCPQTWRSVPAVASCCRVSAGCWGFRQRRARCSQFRRR